jgi:predicted kinase
MSNPIMLILVGQPYSGKTRFRKYIMSLPGMAKRIFVISSDDAIARFSQQNNIPLSVVFDKHYGEVRGLMQKLIEEAMYANRDVIVDRTNVSPQARREWLRLAQQHNYTAIAVVFDMPSENERLERTAERIANSEQPPVPLNVISKMEADYRIPDSHDGFAAILSESEARTMFEAYAKQAAVA